MSDTVEKLSGTWNGKQFSVKKVWGKNARWDGHTITDEELEKLCNGEIIEFEATSGRTGNTYTAKLRINDLTFTNEETGETVPYVGLEFIMNNKEKYNGTWNGKEASFNKVFGGHTITQEEADKLFAGEVIEFETNFKGVNRTSKVKLGGRDPYGICITFA